MSHSLQMYKLFIILIIITLSICTRVRRTSSLDRQMRASKQLKGGHVTLISKRSQCVLSSVLAKVICAIFYV